MNQLSGGIYDPPTAARYLLAGEMAARAYEVDARTLIRWAHQGLATPALESIPGREMILTFEDLVSLRVVAALRSARVSWPRIRRAEQWLREMTDYPRPFAREELWTFGSDVFTNFRGAIIAASRHGQAAMAIIERCLIPVSGLRFENHVARTWEPRKCIILDPEVQFGAPCIKGTRIPVESIVSMIASGDPEELVARAYAITEEEVGAAIDWSARVAA